MKKILLAIAALTAFLPAAAADDQRLRITHGPWLCDMTSDGVTVVWATNLPAMSWVETGPDDGRSFYAEEHPRWYETVDGRRVANKTLHAVRLEGLEPGTKYRYRIFSQKLETWVNYDHATFGEIVSSDVYTRPAYLFETYPAGGADCSFVVLNDIHAQTDFVKRLCSGIDLHDFAFLACNGDMVSSVENEQQLFEGFIDAAVELGASETPILYTRGNHEPRGLYADRLRDYFPMQSGRFYNLYRYGDVCLLTLDCGEDKCDNDVEYRGMADFDAYRERQCAWLREAVRSEAFRSAKARIVFLHIPPVEDWHGNNHLKELFVPVLREAGIDLMLSGHTHTCEFYPAESTGYGFPIVVNSNDTYARCDVSDREIRIRMVDVEGRTTQEHRFPLK